MNRVLSWICCSIPAAVFFVAAYGKILDPVTFFEAIRAYRVIEGPLIGHAVWGLIGLEIIVATALLVPSYRKAAMLIAGAMLVFFMIAVASAKLRGIEVPCGCFGSIPQTAEPAGASVIRNSILLGVLLFPMLLQRYQQKESNLRQSISPKGAIIGGNSAILGHREDR